MGEYADMAIEQGLAWDDAIYSGEVDDDEPNLNYSNRRRRKKTVWFDYRVHEIIRETDKAYHVLFQSDDGKPWATAFWWPKSQVVMHPWPNEGIISVPEWLLTAKFEEMNPTKGDLPDDQR